jgi:diaminopimelate epimerase
MPGGMLTIEVSPDFNLTMKGPVAEVARGSLSPSFVRSLKEVPHLARRRARLVE